MKKRQLFHYPAYGRRLDVEWLFEPRDWWVGVFFDRRKGDDRYPWMQHDIFQHVYIALVPCLPVHIWWYVGKDGAQ